MLGKFLVVPKGFLYGLLLCLCLFAINACSWFQAPTTPKVETPANFNSASVDNQNLESLPYLAWWQRFNDQNLNYLIESSLANNLDVRIAMSNLEQAQGQLKQVQLSWIPSVNLLGGYSSNPALGNAGTFFGVWPQYSINILKLIKQQDEARYAMEMSKAMVDGSRLTLIGQVTASYFTLIANQEQLRLLDGLDNDLQALIKISRDEIKIGVQDDINIAKLLINEQLVKAQTNIVRQNITVAQNSLRYLLNDNPGSIITRDNFAKLDFSQFKPGSLPATVLQNRPDLRMAEYALKSAHAGVAVAYGNLFPTIQLDSFNGASSGSGTVANPSNPTTFNDGYLNWGINPATFGQIEAQKGAYQAHVYKYIQTVRKILKDVDNDFAANRYYLANYQHILQARNELAGRYRLQEGLYKAGIMSYSQLLNAKTELDSLDLSVNQAKLQHAIILVSLYQNLAGGYKYQTSNQH